MPKNHDASYKKFFASPILIRDLLLDFVPHLSSDRIDFDSLENLTSCLTSDHDEERRADMLWRVKVDEEWRYLLVLVEFQSSVDQAMALRMLAYVSLIYQNLRRAEKVAARDLFPPILPIVLYNGEKPWTACKDIVELIATVPAPLVAYVPRMRHLVVDMGRYDLGFLKSKRNLVACVARLERPATSEELLGVVSEMRTLLPEDTELRRLALDWVESVIHDQTEGKIVLPEVQDLTELQMSLSQRFNQWTQGIADENREIGRGEGREEGREEGIAVALKRILTARFGQLPEDISTKIGSASASQIDTWLIRGLGAKTLADVFTD